MADARFGRLQRAATLVPLALLSAAWSVSIATSDGGSAPASASPDGTLPDGSTVPEEAIEAPAACRPAPSSRPACTATPTRPWATRQSTGSRRPPWRPYQRAETVINAADTSCHLPWQLVAAIGRVESDHGRVHGSHLTSEGLARPAIYGLPLDGTQGTARIGDTDAGLLDHDTEFDRAVGPMQFIPSTWAVVGVGRRRRLQGGATRRTSTTRPWRPHGLPLLR
jgi:membrane-bound lytic murein transglycosylase B